MYEFAYPRVLEALAKAAARGVDLRIVFDRRGKESTDPDRPRVWQLSEPRFPVGGGMAGVGVAAVSRLYAGSTASRCQ